MRIRRANFIGGLKDGGYVDFDGPVASSVGRTGFSREPYIIYRVVWLTVWQIREILYFLLQLVGRLMQGIIIGKLPIMALQPDCWRSMGSLN